MVFCRGRPIGSVSVVRVGNSSGRVRTLTGDNAEARLEMFQLIVFRLTHFQKVGLNAIEQADTVPTHGG